MKMVKSLLLGSAAGLMAVAGAQAADLPVKAAPVEYVKICSLYGAGFYYIPGTDICVKIGGYVRGQYYINTGNNGTNGYFFTGLGGNQQTRQANNTNDFMFRTRTIVTMDSRAQTEWGTVRSYMNIGWSQDGPQSGTAGIAFNGSGPSVYANRAFIQWAGFTFGKAQSFYDLFPQAARTYQGLPTHDTGDTGINLAAYTTQWGNGISSTIAIEDPRRFAITNTDVGIGNIWVVGGQLNNDLGNVKYPDIVSNIRIDQAWGSFQVMSAMHDASAAYYFSNNAGAPLGGGCTNVLFPAQAITGAFNCGHPDDKIGWAAGVGGIFNLPFIAAGDTFAFQVNYAQGATRYVSNVQNGGGANPAAFGGSYSIGLGFAQDAVLRDNIFGVQNGSLELTTAWGAIAAFEHFWTPALRTSAYGGFIQFDYNSDATNYICANIAGIPAAGSGAIRPVTFAGAFNQGTCTPDFGLWYVGSRTQWNIRPDFYMGVDVIYQKLDTAFAGLADYAALTGTPRPSGGTNLVGVIATNPGVATFFGPRYRIEDQDALSITFRVHRDIVP